MQIKRYGFCITILLCLLLTGCIHPKYPGQGVTPLVRYHRTLTVRRQWRSNTGAGSYGHYLKLNPAIDRGRIFTVSYLGRITASTVRTGRRLWEDHPLVNFSSGVAVGHGMLFVGAGDGRVFAVKQSTGALLWQQQLSSEVLATPTVTRRYVLVKTEDGRVFALNVGNGRVAWTYSQRIPSIVLRGNSSPQVSHGIVIAGFADGNVVALNLSNGQVRWKRTVGIPQGSTPLSRMVDIDDDPHISGNTVYVASYQGRILALQLRTGQPIWQHKLSSYAGMAVSRNTVFVSDSNDNIWAFNKRDGTVQWKQTALRRREITGPVLIGHSLVVADAEGYIHWLSQGDGRFQARVHFTPKGPIISHPAVRGNQLFVYAMNGYLARYSVTPHRR